MGRGNSTRTPKLPGCVAGSTRVYTPCGGNRRRQPKRPPGAVRPPSPKAAIDSEGFPPDLAVERSLKRRRTAPVTRVLPRTRSSPYGLWVDKVTAPSVPIRLRTGSMGGTEKLTEISISEIPWKFPEISKGQNPFP